MPTALITGASGGIGYELAKLFARDHHNMALMAVYYATKAYVISFSEAIANELHGSGVTVTCFCPGATHTGFAHRAGNDKSRLFKKMGAMSAEKVALDGYRSVMEGRTLAISG